MKLAYLALTALAALLAESSLAATADLEGRTLSFGRKKLVPPSNNTICGLPMQTKGYGKSVFAGRKYKLSIKLTNNVAKDFDSVVVKMTLPEGATFKKASVIPSAGIIKTPALEQDGTEVVWRSVEMRAGKSRAFKIMVLTECGTPTPLIFRSYTTVGGTAWITGPQVKVDAESTRKGCNAIPLGPIIVSENVVTLGTSPSVPPGTWTTQPGTFNANQAIIALPSARRLLMEKLRDRILTTDGTYPFALRQETLSNSSRATTGIYYEPHGICNGLLFKDFVKGGFNFSYEFWVDNAPAGFENTYAPDIRIQTRSPATGRYSDFIWNPAVNGDTNFQEWVTSSMDQDSGSTGGWPVGSTGGSGWACTLGCFVPANTTGTLAFPPESYQTYRSLETYVEGLESFDKCSSAFCAINDAIITGIQIVLGSNEPDTVAFTRKVGFTANGGQCTYDWIFGAV